MTHSSKNVLTLLGPGILVAATGVGAGDLATASFTGNALGVTVLWAVILGAAIKYILNEGLARWQLATNKTLLEGAVTHLGLPFQIFFLTYLVFWSFFVGSALISACGVAGHALFPIFGTPETGKIVFGVIHSVLGVILSYYGGYKLFEKVMGFFITLMFVTVLVTATLVAPPLDQILSGLLIPQIPDLGGQGLGWTIALMGGVGGTVTVLSYGYWIRETGRCTPEDIRISRIDLAVGYGITALFGICMVIIGNAIVIEGQGAGLIVTISERLEAPLGPAGKWIFLIGAWGAMFSSLLGVWQSVPYLFADFWSLLKHTQPISSGAMTLSAPYRWYQLALASIPLIGLTIGFQQIQKLYAIVGAAFMPTLALILLVLNGSSKHVGADMCNNSVVNTILVLILIFFIWASWPF